MALGDDNTLARRCAVSTMTTLVIATFAVLASEVASPLHAVANTSWIFQSPTGNIACHISETGAACEIGRYQYTPPPRPANCDNEWGDRIGFDHGGGPAFFGCNMGTFLGDLPTQRYDTPLTAGPITCVIHAASGVTCRDSKTGQYFRLSQQSYELG